MCNLVNYDGTSHAYIICMVYISEDQRSMHLIMLVDINFILPKMLFDGHTHAAAHIS